MHSVSWEWGRCCGCYLADGMVVGKRLACRGLLGRVSFLRKRTGCERGRLRVLENLTVTCMK